MPERPPFDACVIGHVVLDRNVIDGMEQPPCPGGAAYYAGLTYARLGLRTAVATRVAAADEELLLGELRAAGVQVVNRGAPCSTVFRNVDSPAAEVRRVQRVDAMAPAVGPGDLAGLASRAWHLGPLRRDDLDDGLLDACRRRGGLVAIDIQGLTRRVEGGRVLPERPSDQTEPAAAHVLKADDAEVLTFTGCDEVDRAARRLLGRGAGEVVVTEADRGSILFTGKERIVIPAYRPERELDPTGCGDTYLAAYLARRLETPALEECGRFAAAVAALKLEAGGPFRGDREAVAAFRARADLD